MDKNLVLSEKEYMNIFWEKDLDSQEIGSLLKIEFAFQDGTYPSDWIKGIDVNEDQDVDINTYRKDEESIFPETYHCVVVSFIENEFDRLGRVQFRFLDFVYKEDFLL